MPETYTPLLQFGLWSLVDALETVTGVSRRTIVGGVSLYALLLDFKNGIYQQTRTRTNLAPYSQDLTKTATWNADTMTMTGGNAGAPDGSSTAGLFSIATGSTNYPRQNSLQLTAGTTYTVSAWLWAGANVATSVNFAYYNGAWNVGPNISLTTTPIRYTWTVTPTTTSTLGTGIKIVSSASGSNTYMWGFQLEAAPAASAYIPTTSAAVSVTESITDQTPVRTNFVTGSKDMLTGWGPTAATAVVSSAALPPALVGLATGAVDLTFTTPAANDRLVQSVTLSAGTYTQSIWAKTSSGTKNFRLGGLNNASPDFTATTTWQRFSWVSTATPSGVFFATVLNEAAGSAGGVTIAGYQIEAGNTLGGFIPTGSTIVTVGAVTDLYGYTYSRSGAKEEVGTTYGPEWAPSLASAANFPIYSGSPTVTSDGSTLTLVAPAVAAGIYLTKSSNPNGGLVVGKTYQITFMGTGTNFTVQCVGGGAAVAFTNAFGTATFTATNTDLIIRPAGATTITVNSLSIKEVIPASSFAANVPAIIPGTGYFARPAYTNLLLWSQDFTNAAWNKSNGTVTTGFIAPDGSSTANKLVENTVAAVTHDFYQGITVVNATTYTVSVFAKAGERSQIQFQYYDGVTNKYPVFSLTDGTKVADGGIGTAWTSTNVGNGWWRFTLTVTSGATAGAIHAYPAAGGSNQYTGDGTSGIYLWQAQVVQASDPGPIIVTTSGTAAVGADVLTLPPTFSADQDMLIAIKLNMPSIASISSGNTSVLEFTDGTAANRLVLYAFNLTQWGIYTNSGNTIQRNTPITNATITTGTQILAIRRRSGKYTGAYVSNTGTVTVEAEGGATTFPVGMNKLAVATNFSSTNQLNGVVQSVIIRPGTFSDTDLTNILTAL